VLRSTLVDYYRRRGDKKRCGERINAEPAHDESREEASCPYLERALPAIKGESGDLVRCFDLLGEPRSRAAEAFGISAHAFRVRLFHARTVVRKKLTSFCRGECDRCGTTCRFGRINHRTTASRDLLRGAGAEQTVMTRPGPRLESVYEGG